jgi:hypothetical protein
MKIFLQWSPFGSAKGAVAPPSPHLYVFLVSLFELHLWRVGISFQLETRRFLKNFLCPFAFYKKI